MVVDKVSDYPWLVDFHYHTCIFHSITHLQALFDLANDLAEGGMGAGFAFSSDDLGDDTDDSLSV